jgi:ribonuclease G
MSKELVVSAGRHETRVAILDDDQVVELFHEREKEYSLAGSIHKGRVTRVLPGMQSAFVDIGLERDAFLYVSDFFEDNDEYDAVVSTVEEKVLKMEKGGAAEPPREGRKAIESGPAEGEAPAAEPAAVSAVAAGAGAAEGRPEGNREGRDDRNRDRGGRGRRGRRRRGGRSSSLPESKFFSPSAESAAAAESDAEVEAEEVESAPEFTPTPRAFETRDDFMVLPGESLAKYTAPDAEESDHAEPQEPVEQPQVASALPGEHPLAGFGEVASWVTSPEAEETIAEAAAPAEPPVETREDIKDEPEPAESLVEAQAPVAVEPPGVVVAPEPVTPDADIVEGDIVEADIVEEDEGISAAEVAEDLVAVDAVAAEEAFADSAAESEPSGESAEEEGPEPARIPTSLTAALREQGHRYPHRVSRRMRRRMRSGEGRPDGQRPEGQNREKQTPDEAAPTPEPRAENRNISQRREDRAEPRESRGEPREPREPRESRGGRERERSSEPREVRERPPMPSISDLLKEGQEIIVQIAKEPLGQKGARITSHIALPGRFVVYMPTVEHVGVSRKIPSDEERQRLKRVLQTHREGVPGGFICRTAAENKSEEELRSDMHFLYNLWLDMRQKAEKKPAPLLLHHDLDLVQRILRDQLTTSFKTIWVDNEELYTSILNFVERFQPALVGRVKLYTRANPIFDEFGITAEIEKALRPKVWLKSGGYIVINQTEALVAVDINTGKYVGKSNRLEDTIVKINTDAIKEIVRQIRLRDLGGIIVVDFIDMDERKNRQKVMLALEDAMRVDRAPYKILQFNDFGLVAITRKRVKQSLERTLCTPCAYCEGAGYIKSVPTVVTEILQEAQKIRKALEAEQSNIVLRVNPEVARVLKSNHNSYLQEIEEIVGKSVLVKSDPLLHQTKFDLA